MLLQLFMEVYQYLKLSIKHVSAMVGPCDLFFIGIC